MSSDNRLERLWKIQANVNKLILDGKRDPDEVSRSLQAFIDGKPVLPVEATPPKFSLFLHLGTIVVPRNFRHSTCLAKFKRKDGSKFYYFDDNINDKNYSHPSTILTPGRRLEVKVFKQVVESTTTSEERLAFLKSQKCLFTGAQGASLVFQQKRDSLLKGYWYLSFDEKENLWHSGGYHRVPHVYRYSDGDFRFGLGDFEGPWGGAYAFFCFCDNN